MSKRFLLRKGMQIPPSTWSLTWWDVLGNSKEVIKLTKRNPPQSWFGLCSSFHHSAISGHRKQARVSSCLKVHIGSIGFLMILDVNFPPLSSSATIMTLKWLPVFLTTTQAWRNMAMWTKHTVFLYKSFQCKIAAKTQEGFQICW